MANNYVNFISDEHLIKCIDILYNSYLKAKENLTKETFYKNKIDVIKLTFDSKFNEISEEDLINNEIIRQVDKTITNHIGTFHENILSGIKNFEKLPTGCDIKSNDNKIFIELKNKFNTVKGEDSRSIFIKLKELTDKNPGSKGYYARILDTKKTNKNWELSYKKVKYKDPSIYIISGDELYKLMTKEENALFQLYKILPKAIDDYLKSIEKDKTVKENSALDEISSETEKSKRTILDQITFENYSYYLGFDKL
ncbi:Eco47II family restriction endonuclease [Faecalibacter macacae]|uniref:Eco47II family restriction endonuclease n=1 Tax=Faecalibacter macacae TaxID=1859289 RepID=A0A3L9M048_9FLAO|nr:Eco47II family restriction endonuclease [Faecalibacter macacae]RLZ06530.1 Eco47II family restriction endonuclease [Faecalibacter macacae]